MKKATVYCLFLILFGIQSQKAFTQSSTRAVLDSVTVQKGKEDGVSLYQSADAFNTLEDGQPTPPGYVEFRILPTWAYSRAESNIFGVEPELEYTPKGGKFLENSQLLASFFLEHDGTDNSGQLNLGWNQRWCKDGGHGSLQPTLGTLVEVNFPLPGLRNTDAFLEGSKAGSFIKITGVYAKFVGPGSFYVNLSARRQFGSQVTSDGDVWTKDLYGFRVGYMWIVKPDKFNIIVDYNKESNEFATQNVPDAELHDAYNTIEVSTEWRVSEHLTLGPGFEFGIDGRDETPVWGAGILILVE